MVIYDHLTTLQLEGGGAVKWRRIEKEESILRSSEELI